MKSRERYLERAELPLEVSGTRGNSGNHSRCVYCTAPGRFACCNAVHADFQTATFEHEPVTGQTHTVLIQLVSHVIHQKVNVTDGESCLRRGEISRERVSYGSLLDSNFRNTIADRSDLVPLAIHSDLWIKRHSCSRVVRTVSSWVDNLSNYQIPTMSWDVNQINCNLRCQIVLLQPLSLISTVPESVNYLIYILL